jgi:hypothetical protein
MQDRLTHRGMIRLAISSAVAIVAVFFEGCGRLTILAEMQGGSTMVDVVSRLPR